MFPPESGLPAKGGVVLVGLPLDVNSSFLRGSARGPGAVREALYTNASSLWTEDGLDLAEPGLMADAGDLDLDQGPDSFGIIEGEAARLVKNGRRPLFLGGDHSVTFPAVKGPG